MIKEKITVQETVDFLNALLEIDPPTISALVSLRISCNKKLADHETVQVGVLSEHHFQVGLIGILNGLFGADKFGWGHISATYTDGIVIKFEALTGENVASFLKKKKKQYT